MGCADAPWLALGRKKHTLCALQTKLRWSQWSAVTMHVGII